MSIFIFLIIGYLLGSLSPGFFFGRLVKNIDIREFRNKNTGAANTYHLVGPIYGIIAGIFDALKAAAAYFIATKGLPLYPALLGKGGVDPDTAILAGIAAVAGHIWPFYLKFQGGRGAASLAGLMVITLYYTTSWYALIFTTGAIIYGMIFNKVEFKAPIRKMLKLGGLIFPLGLLWFEKSAIINVIGTLLTIALIFDFLRFAAPRFNLGYLKISSLAKQKEKRFLSGYTLFLIGMATVLRFFSPEIAVFVTTAFIVSDILAPAGKRVFLPIPFIKEKTVGGAMVIFAVTVLAGIFLSSLAQLPLSLNMVLIGAVVMAFLDQLSFIVDDNILVPVGTAAILAILT